LQHCDGGTGPSVFGQNGEGPGDPGRDIHAALEKWVEGGAAPASIVATKYKSPGVVERMRPLCPYPQTAHYTGSGSTDDSANFVCR
jgi:feruloyl esterase